MSVLSSSGSIKNKRVASDPLNILPLHNYHQRRPLHTLSEGVTRSLSNSPQSWKQTTNRFRSSDDLLTTTTNTTTTTTTALPSDSPVLVPSAWSANPQSPGDDPVDYGNGGDHDNYNNGMVDHESLPGVNAFSTTQQYRRTSSGTSSSWWLVSLSNSSWPCLALASIMFMAGLVVALQSRWSLLDSMEQVLMLTKNGQQLHIQLSDAEKGIRLLQREVSAYEAMMHDTNGNKMVDPLTNPALYAHQKALEEMQQLSSRLQESQQKADKLKTKVQQLAKQEAIANFGDHTHRVEIELAFPDGREGPTKFVIELAPIDIMPHSVHFFLEMVHSGLLDGCSFILNALHVLKAAPLPYDGSSAANKARAFTRMGLESVAFKEYSDQYPHEQYTVGFAADGSPSFYINTEDNSEIHLGDPCFGKIVEGFDTVKRLESSPTRNGIWFEQRIGIKRATVLS